MASALVDAYTPGESRIMADLNDFYPSGQPSLGNVATGGRMPGTNAGSTNGAGAGASLSGNVSGSVGAPAAWVLGLVALSLLLLHLE